MILCVFLLRTSSLGCTGLPWWAGWLRRFSGTLRAASWNGTRSRATGLGSSRDPEYRSWPSATQQRPVRTTRQRRRPRRRSLSRHFPRQEGRASLWAHQAGGNGGTCRRRGSLLAGPLGGGEEAPCCGALLANPRVRVDRGGRVWSGGADERAGPEVGSSPVTFRPRDQHCEIYTIFGVAGEQTPGQGEGNLGEVGDGD